MEQEFFRITPPKKLFVKLAFPSFVGMLFSSLYMLLDGMFVGQVIGMKALAAVHVVFPMIRLMLAVGDMIAIGSSVKIGIKLGERKNEEACHIFSVAILLIFIINTLFMIGGLIFAKDFLVAITKDSELATLSYRFAFVFILALPFIAPFAALDHYVRLCGGIKISMWVNITVSLFNILLDVILIGWLKLEIEYVALSSVLSMYLGTVVLFYPFMMKRLALRWVRPKIRLKEVGAILSVLTNGLLLYYGGATAVAAFSIVMYVDALISPILLSLIGAIQPVISYTYGSKNNRRLLELFKMTCRVGFTISVGAMLIMMVFPDFLVGLFSSKSDVGLTGLGKVALLLGLPSYLFSWFSLTVESFFTGLEKATESMIVLVVESVILPVLLMVALTKVMGVYGIFLVPTVSGCISFVLALGLWRQFVNKELNPVRFGVK